jgi:3,4-dihydroxy 2-butanone 4-phosphate synthase/GTP cyclohydrolase II
MLDENAKPEDIVTPGHMFPLKAKPGGVLSRPGHTEGSVDLAKLSGLKPAAVICEILNEEGDAARGDELDQFAKEHNLQLVSINELIAYRFQHESLVNIQASSALPTESGDEFTIKIFQSRLDNAEHIALIKGDLQQTDAPIVRIHSECLTSDILGSTRCDCGEQLKTSLAKISEEGGILLYLRQEGRGIGLANKIKAYSLQDQGMDTVEANHHLGYPADARDYGIGVQMLRKLGVNKVRMLTNNPNKIKSFSRYGLEVVERLPIEVYPKPDNIAYLTAKRDKMGHMLALLKEVG